MMSSLKALQKDVEPSDRAPAAHQIHDDHDQGDHQQQVNQSTRHMQAKAQEPQNQKYRNNRPKHFQSPSFIPDVPPSAQWGREPATFRIPNKNCWHAV
jgi:hypothetical protein